MIWYILAVVAGLVIGAIVTMVALILAFSKGVNW